MKMSVLINLSDRKLLPSVKNKHFPFLGFSDNYISGLQCRTVFCTALTRLLMVNLGEDENEFKNFMLPLAVSFESVTQMLSSSLEQEAKRMLIGLARDLRGIAFALNTKTSYTMLFDWIYPTYICVLQKGIELWYQEPACATPILKLMAEFMQSRSRRLNFDGSSPNGILLLREASGMICTYTISKAKPVLLPAFGMSDPGSHGFHYQLRASCPDLYPYLPIWRTYCSSCCASLDHFVTQLFQHVVKEGKALWHTGTSQDGQRLFNFVQHNLQVLQQMMSVLMNTIIFEHCRNQRSVSGPLLGLTLLSEKYFSELRAALVNSQPGSKRQVLEQCFRNLMKGVEQNLSMENRDWFTQNVSVFRRDRAELLHSEGAADAGSLGMKN